jgi:two-component system, NarL family, response regulator DevR
MQDGRMKTIQLLIIDDHEVVRLGLRTLLSDYADIQVVAEAGSAREGLAALEQFHPQVAIVDIHLPDRNGLDVCREIVRQFPETRVIILTSSAQEEFLVQALQAGATGYVLKNVGNQELIRAIYAAWNGQTALDPQTTSQMVSRWRNLEAQTQADAFRNLSPREVEVLALVAEGRSNKEIGATLHLRDVTVRNYVSNILDKLDLTNRVELTRYALVHNLSLHKPE